MNKKNNKPENFKKKIPSNKSTKVIRMKKSKKYNSYSFEERIISSEEVEDFFKNINK